MSKHILLVEDDEDLRGVVSDLLSVEGYKVTAATNGREGWNLLIGRSDIDLVLLDFAMPQLDARGFRELQRSSPSVKDIPVVLFSAAVLSESVLSGLAPTAVLAKPVDIDDLITTVKRLSA